MLPSHLAARGGIKSNNARTTAIPHFPNAQTLRPLATPRYYHVRHSRTRPRIRPSSSTRIRILRLGQVLFRDQRHYCGAAWVVRLHFPEGEWVGGKRTRYGHDQRRDMVLLCYYRCPFCCHPCSLPRGHRRSTRNQDMVAKDSDLLRSRVNIPARLRSYAWDFPPVGLADCNVPDGKRRP